MQEIPQPKDIQNPKCINLMIVDDTWMNIISCQKILEIIKLKVKIKFIIKYDGTEAVSTFKKYNQ